MLSILYGVSGEGSGHSSRSRAMAEHLLSRGYRIKMASYGRGLANLQDDFDVVPMTGLTIEVRNNHVSPLLTVVENIRRMPGLIRSIKRLKQVFRNDKPDVVITDFEPLTAYLAGFYRVPLISLDNQHRFRYMEYPQPPRSRKDRWITETVVRTMVPKPDVSLVTTFYFGRVKNNHTFLFPPILRSEVLATKAQEGENILVYATKTFDGLLDVLKQFSRERFLVYGFDKEDQDGNLTFKAFSRDGFLEDLACCKAVIATAGFTLMTESLYFQKPYFALPMQGQFEQMLNAHLLQSMGYGVSCRTVSEQAVAAFLERLPEFEQALSAYQHNGNEAIKSKLSALLDNGAASLKQMRRRQKN